MKVGDFVEVDYVGRMKDSGQVFDLTKEDVAKKEDVYNRRQLNIGSPLVLFIKEFLLI